MMFFDLLGFAGENRGVNIIAVITLFGISVYTKTLTSFALGLKKIAAGVPVIEHFRHCRRRFVLLGVFLILLSSGFSIPEIYRARSIFRRRLRCRCLLPGCRIRRPPSCRRFWRPLAQTRRFRTRHPGL